jgi:hypothetical protein
MRQRYSSFMEHIVLLNVVFFVPAVSGACAVALLWLRMLRVSAPPAPPGGGGLGITSPVDPRQPRSAGPDDLARSA